MRDVPTVDTAPGDAPTPTRRPAPARPWRSWRSWPTALAVAITLAPFAVLAVHVLRSELFPIGDLATTEMLTRDVGARSPSLGPYSRDGWFHPGPALFYVLALPYRLLGGDGPALAVAAVLVNAVSVATMGVLAGRRGGRSLLLTTLLGTAVLTSALGPTLLATPWNVHVTVLPYGAFVFLVWTVFCGDVWALPLATLVATFLVQTHVGYAAAALPLWAAALAWTAWVALARFRRARRGRAAEDTSTTEPSATEQSETEPSATEPSADADAPAETAGASPDAGAPSGTPSTSAGPALLSLAVTALVGLLAWLPPVTEETSHEPGNLTRIVEWFRESGDESRTLLVGWRVVADQYTLWPEWIAGQGPLSIVAEPMAVYERIVPVLLVPVLAAVVVLWRRGGVPARALAGVWFAASALGVVSVARTIGPLYAYRLLWLWVLGMLAGILTVWGAWLGVRGRLGPGAAARVRSAGTAVALVILAVLSTVASVRATRADVPQSRLSAVVGDLVPDTLAALEEVPGDGKVVVRTQSFGSIGVGLGLIDELDRRGVDAVIEDVGAGEHRRLRSGDATRVVLVVGVGEDVPLAAGDPALEIVAWTGERDLDRIHEDAARIDALERQVAYDLITPDEYRERLDAVRAASTATVAIERPTG